MSIERKFTLLNEDARKQFFEQNKWKIESALANSVAKTETNTSNTIVEATREIIAVAEAEEMDFVETPIVEETIAENEAESLDLEAATEDFAPEADLTEELVVEDFDFDTTEEISLDSEEDFDFDFSEEASTEEALEGEEDFDFDFDVDDEINLDDL